MFQILRASDKFEANLWDALIDELPPERRDIHFTSAYGRVQEALGARAVLAVLTDLEEYIAQPFIIRPIMNSNGSFDLCSPYGYGGPVSNMTKPDVMGAMMRVFQMRLTEWSLEERIVSEFSRLHPMIAGHQFALLADTKPDMTEEKCVTAIPLDAMSTSTVARRVRRALKAIEGEGNVVELAIDDALRLEFSMLYDASMQRKNAATRWLFEKRYFDAHFDELQARLFRASDGIGNRLLMVIGLHDVAYAHFLASNGESRHSGLDDLLYFRAGELLRDNGFKIFHLGGGASSNPSDSLLAFKRGFGGHDFQTYTYRRVIDEAAYFRLINEKARAEFNEHGRESISNFFPAYRREFA